MDPEKAAESFVDLFHEVFLRFHDRAPADERGLSMEARGVLQHLSSAGPLTITEAARHFGRSQAATSEIVARLESRGLLVRFPDERDRRRHLVWLSDEGVKAWRRAQRVLDPALVAEALGRLSDEEQEDIVRALRRLLDSGHLQPETPKEDDA